MTRRWLVAGRVQGVGFRYFVVRRATELGLHGWVRNLADGRVEVLAEGAPRELDELHDLLLLGPKSAAVERVEVAEISDEQGRHKSFDVR